MEFMTEMDPAMQVKLSLMFVMVFAILALSHATLLQRRTRRLWLLGFSLMVLGWPMTTPVMAKGSRNQQNSRPADPEAAAKKKAADEAYQAALKAVPVSNVKADPWAKMR